MIDQYGDFYMVAISSPDSRKKFALIAGVVSIGTLVYNGWLFLLIFLIHWGLVGAYMIRLILGSRGKEFEILLQKLDQNNLNQSVHHKIINKIKTTQYPSLLDKESKEAIVKIYKIALIKFFELPSNIDICNFYLTIESFYFHLKPQFWREIATLFSTKNVYVNPPILKLEKFKRKNIDIIKKQISIVNKEVFFQEFIEILKGTEASNDYELKVYEAAQKVLIDNKFNRKSHEFYKMILDWYMDCLGSNKNQTDISTSEYQIKFDEIKDLENYLEMLQKKQNLQDVMSFIENVDERHSSFVGSVFEKEYQALKHDLMKQYIETLFVFLEKGKIHKRILSSLVLVLSKTNIWDSQAIYNRVLDIYESSSHQDSLKVFVLKVGRMHFASKSFFGEVEPVDEETIKNDILMRTRS